MKQIRMYIGITIFSLLLFMVGLAQTKGPLTAEDVLKMEQVVSAKMSPDGHYVAYLKMVPRKSTEKPGGAWTELYVLNVKSGESRPFITGKKNIWGIDWVPDGSGISFLARRDGQKKTQVWVIPIDGGEPWQATGCKAGINTYKWHPSGKSIAFITVPPASSKEKTLQEKGYGFIYYEENIKPRVLLTVNVKRGEFSKPRKISNDMSVWSFEFSPDGKTIAVAMSPKNLIDQKYMFQKIYILNPETKEFRQISKNEGKLGNYAFSPDGKYLAYNAALNQNDNANSQAFVVPVAGGDVKNLTRSKYRGHIDWVGWKNNSTLLYHAGEGTTTKLYQVSVTGKNRRLLLDSEKTGFVFYAPAYTPNFKQFVVLGNSPSFPTELFLGKSLKNIKKMTTSNLWLKEKNMGRQEVISYKARDGKAIEGLLIYPADYTPGTQYPLVVIVHGGPESHYSNGWVTRYATPGQVLAGRGYAVFYPNYRASTGYGVDFAMEGFGDPAGKEFDDIADGIDFLIKKGIADKNRVGLGGGSYGGYAAAWFGTYYTKYVKAVCMFVGISDLISKKGTTDIPWEELYVHAGKKLEDSWEQSLKRSPIYWAHQSKSAVLIFGGAADTRVHPSQSMELYRRLKVNGHPAVRLVQYPGEGHGNRRQPGRIDVLYRVLDWYDWYVKDAKPLDGDMPPLDISDKYNLGLNN